MITNSTNVESDDARLPIRPQIAIWLDDSDHAVNVELSPVEALLIIRAMRKTVRLKRHQKALDAALERLTADKTITTVN